MPVVASRSPLSWQHMQDLSTCQNFDPETCDERDVIAKLCVRNTKDYDREVRQRFFSQSCSSSNEKKHENLLEHKKNSVLDKQRMESILGYILDTLADE